MVKNIVSNSEINEDIECIKNFIERGVLLYQNVRNRFIIADKLFSQRIRFIKQQFSIFKNSDIALYKFWF